MTSSTPAGPARRARLRGVVLPWLALLSVGCSPACSDPSSAGARSDGPVVRDAGAPAPDLSTVPASRYCESIVDFFCPFYIRCGRMAAASVAECRAVFIEACNARFEPRYEQLEAAGLIALSREGLAACEAHLGVVPCDDQLQDLQGPCAGIWRGGQAAGEPCGLDLESLICAPGSTCALTLALCGTCEIHAALGAPCDGGTRCPPEAHCDGTCKSRPRVGEVCGASAPCLLPARCEGGRCSAPTIVKEGEACDRERRCPYRTDCVGGRCEKGGLLGEACGAGGLCSSGRCEGGRCVALRPDGEGCASSAECRSQSCVSGKCKPLPSACVRGG